MTIYLIRRPEWKHSTISVGYYGLHSDDSQERTRQQPPDALLSSAQQLGDVRCVAFDTYHGEFPQSLCPQGSESMRDYKKGGFEWPCQSQTSLPVPVREGNCSFTALGCC